MCAGITTFNCLRNSGARAGEVVAILGLGGSASLQFQFAAKWSFRTIGIARGKDKESFAKKLVCIITSTVRIRIRPQNFSSSAGLRSFWPP